MIQTSSSYARYNQNASYTWAGGTILIISSVNVRAITRHEKKQS
ncbi:hypothetical protein [Pontibacter ramchanderi]|nr:hypothetical protein [Pontibacter ramchanderi]